MEQESACAEVGFDGLRNIVQRNKLNELLELNCTPEPKRDFDLTRTIFVTSILCTISICSALLVTLQGHHFKKRFPARKHLINRKIIQKVKRLSSTSKLPEHAKIWSRTITKKKEFLDDRFLAENDNLKPENLWNQKFKRH